MWLWRRCLIVCRSVSKLTTLQLMKNYWNFSAHASWLQRTQLHPVCNWYSWYFLEFEGTTSLKICRGMENQYAPESLVPRREACLQLAVALPALLWVLRFEAILNWRLSLKSPHNFPKQPIIESFTARNPTELNAHGFPMTLRHCTVELQITWVANA